MPKPEDKDFPPPLPPEPEPPPLTREGTSTIDGLLEKLQKSYGFFSDMSRKELAWFLRLCSRRSYEAGDMVFREGEMGDCFYLIVSGEVLISRGTAQLARLREGNCFGEMAVLESVPRSATAVATQKTLVFCVERDILTDVFPSLGFKVAANLAKNLSSKLREADERLRKNEAPPR